jgi:hypothetical protein
MLQLDHDGGGEGIPISLTHHIITIEPIRNNQSIQILIIISRVVTSSILRKGQ